MTDQPHAAGEPSTGLPRGVRLGVDVGTVRVGVAASDPDGLIATPLRTVQHVPGRHTDVEEVVSLIQETQATAVYVGLPRTLAGDEGESARRARDFATALLGSETSPCGPAVEVRLVDERLTTVDAARQLRDSGRSARTQRAVIDQAAAVLILQVALDHEGSTGRRAGSAVSTAEPAPGPRRRKARHRGH